MNDSEPNPTPAFAQDSKQFCAALQGQVTFLMLAMVILSGILTAYLYVQQRYAIQDREANKQVVEQIVQVFRQQQKPLMDGFLEKLREYSKTHPDFIPVLNKYGYGSQAVPGTIMPSTLPKIVKTNPAPAAAPKK